MGGEACTADMGPFGPGVRSGRRLAPVTSRVLVRSDTTVTNCAFLWRGYTVEPRLASHPANRTTFLLAGTPSRGGYSPPVVAAARRPSGSRRNAGNLSLLDPADPVQLQLYAWSAYACILACLSAINTPCPTSCALLPASSQPFRPRDVPPGLGAAGGAAGAGRGQPAAGTQPCGAGG